MSESTVMNKEKITCIPEGGFDRKLTDEEIDELLENYGYDPDYYAEDGSDTPREIFDRFGNPTRPTLDVMYEKKHGIAASEGPMTLDEFKVWFDDILAETEEEEQLVK